MEQVDFITTVMTNQDPAFVRETLIWLVECIKAQHPTLPEVDRKLVDNLITGPPSRSEYLALPEASKKLVDVFTLRRPSCDEYAAFSETERRLVDSLIAKPPSRDEYLWVFLMCLCSANEVRARATRECARHRVEPFLLQLSTEFGVFFLGNHSYCHEVDDEHPPRYSGVDQFVRRMQMVYASRYDPHGLFVDYALSTGSIAPQAPLPLC